MADEHEWYDEQGDQRQVAGDVNPDPEPEAGMTDEAGGVSGGAAEGPLFSAEQFDDELARLETEGEDPEATGEYTGDEELRHQPAESTPADFEGVDIDREGIEALDDEERLRGPRAQSFRRRLRDQLSMLPLAGWLVALGGFLLAREQKVDGLPNLSNLALAELSVLAVATTLIMHALLSGRRERGLLFFGLWIWATAGMVAGLVYGIENQPDVTEWWPLILWSLAITLLLTYLLERTHDARLLLLSTVVLVAGAAAYAVTSERISRNLLDRAEEYWPLLLSILGIVLLPLAFQRRQTSR